MKLRRLARALRIHRAQAIGHLHFLWWWALDNAPTGDLSALAPAEIAEVAEWTGDAEAFVQTLKDCGWIDPDGRMHDWDDYAGRLVADRNADRDRKRLARQAKRTPNGHPPDVHRTSTGHPPDIHRTSGVPNPTQPNQEEAHSPAGARDGPWPTLAEVLSIASMRAIPAECAEKWWLEHDARGGLDARGQPIARWQSSLQAYAVAWRATDTRSKMAGRANSGAARGIPEPKQIQENVPLPMIEIK